MGAGATKVSPDQNSLIKDRPPATIELVQSWCRASHTSDLTENGALAIARFVNEALFLEAFWRDETKAWRDENPSTQGLKRVSEALATLQSELPSVIEDSRYCDHSLTTSLLDLVNRHQAVIDAFPKPKQGRTKSLEKNLATNLGKELLRVSGGKVSNTELDAFVACAMTWLRGLPVPTSDEATRKARERRT